MSKVFLLLLALGPSTALNPSDWNCGSVVWVAPPVVDASKTFIGTSQVDCVVAGRSGKGLDGLEKYLHARALDSEQVLSGPDAVELEGMPGRRFVLRDTDALGSDRVTIEAELVFATDFSTRLVSQSTSRKVQGTGNAAYLRKSDLRIEVTPDENPGRWKFRFTQLTHVKKPPIIGGGAFKNEVVKTIERDSAAQIQKSFAGVPEEL